jgi:hypothetical protein
VPIERTEGEQRAFERGATAGAVDAQLAAAMANLGHIQSHLATIDGRLANLELRIQRLTDLGEAREATVATTAAALETARRQRAETVEQNWSPVQKIILVISGLAALAVVLAFLINTL